MQGHSINIHPKSGYSWESFLENLFFQEVMIQLQNLLVDDFNNYFFEFYLHNGDYLNIISCSTKRKVKKILFLLCDEHNNLNEKNTLGYDIIFKTYLNQPNLNIIPLPIGFNSQVKNVKVKATSERAYNVFFSGNLNQNRLTGLYKSLHKLNFLPSKIFSFLFERPRLQNILGIRFPDKPTTSKSDLIVFSSGFNSGLNKSEYTDSLNNSKIALCPKGFVSAETFRLYEALRQGCIVISERLPKHSFYKESPIFEIDSWNDLSGVLKELNSMDLDELQKQSLRYYDCNLSEYAVAQYIKKNLH